MHTPLYIIIYILDNIFDILIINYLDQILNNLYK